MSFLDHIRICNDHDPSRYLPFAAAGQRVGWVARDFAARLAGYGDAFAATADGVTLHARYADFDSRTAAVDAVVRRLRDDGVVKGWRNESYAVAPRFGAPPLFRVERAAAPLFGVTSLGVHINGIVRTPRGLKMWVGRRSPTKPTYPDQLDNLCAGGISFGHGVRDTLIKEAGEEANIPPELAARAVPCGAITYCCERDGGLRPDILFVYDLELPDDFVPRPNDGEIADFRLWPIDDVIAAVRDSREFKFNCNLVIIDFLIRHGLIGPEEPDYLALVAGLRRWVGREPAAVAFDGPPSQGARP